MKQSSRPKIWLRLCSGLLLALFLTLCISPQGAAARSVRFTELRIDAEILSDGSLVITEYRTARFDGTFTGMYQWINKEPGVTIEDVRVGEIDKPYRFIPGATTYGPENTFYVLDEGRRLYIDWSYAATDETRTFVISYRVLGQVKLHDDVAELYYQFVGDQWDYGVDQVSVTLTLPEGAEQSDLRAWGHGPLHGEVEIVGPRQVKWSIEKLPAHTFLEGRVTFPTSLISGEHAQRTHRQALEQILAEENQWARSANRERALSFAGVAGAVGARVFAVYWAARCWRLGGRPHPTTFDGDYYRELPGEYSPAELAVLWRHGDPTTDDFTATILDLARRGYLRIEEAVVEKRGLLRSTSETTYYLTRQEKEAADLAAHEVDALKFIFSTVGKAASNEPDANRVSFDDIEAYAKKHQGEFRSFWQGWIGVVRFEAECHEFFDNGPEITRARTQLWIGALLTMLLMVPAVIWAPLAMFGLVPATIILFIVPLFLNRRSPSGQEDYVRWQAFRRFLLHFSQMERHTIPSLVIWEHYLVYAVTLGVAKEVMKQLELVYPNLTDGTYRFGYGWYYWPMARRANPLGFTNSFTALSSTMAQSIRAATSTRSSGSGFGGGFSGGGGFGGGGGGGGVR
ncbi:MAG: DUF2207 domain-containing protein [Firmicutes bacterium]|nr:DUF2207 domain-containing protein [Bacillota bacterium]